MRPRGVAVNMPPCHGGDRRFESDRGRHFFFAAVAQSVEQRTENPRVGGSIPSCGTIVIATPFLFGKAFFYVRKGLNLRSATEKNECIKPKIHLIANAYFESIFKRYKYKYNKHTIS